MKKNIAIVILTAWILGTTGYVIYDLWSDYQVQGIGKAYNAGMADTVDQLIAEVGKTKCSPVDVSGTKEKIQVVDARCLPASNADQTKQPDAGQINKK